MTKFQNTIQTGMSVWFMDNYDNIQNGTVIEIVPTKNGDYVHVRIALGGTMHTPRNSVYESQQACMDAFNQAQRNKTDEYKQTICSINDLVSFCLNHTVSYAEEYTDYAARKAVIERASELGLTIPETF